MASAAGIALLAQELIPGPERLVESYHAYVDGTGAIAGEFTGRKIRTLPAAFGFSTAVEITDAPDVRRVGREALERLGLTGVAKADFKRAPDGALWLLEINPRFNLWHYPAAIAGVNLPVLAHADLTGAPRPTVRRPRPGVTWCQPLKDLRAARSERVPLARWLRFLAACDARSTLALDDPMPFLRGRLGESLRRPRSR